MRDLLRRCSFILLCLCIIVTLYLQLPIRPAIATYTAERFMQTHYTNYQISDVFLYGQGYHEQRILGAYLTYTTHYSVQARAVPCAVNGASCLVMVDCNGLCPFYIEQHMLFDSATGRILEE